VALSVLALRADGVTPVGSFSMNECESIFYRVTLAPIPLAGMCAFEGGALTLTTPDGIVHPIADPVPCMGGTGACTNPPVVSPLIPYTARPDDVLGGTLTARADYEGGGVAHDSAGNTPGLGAATPRSIPAVGCPTQPLDPCASAKVLAASKFFLARGKCIAKAVKGGTNVDSICLRKAQATLAKKFVSVETKLSCITVEDVGTVMALDQSCSDALLSQVLFSP
jgi:hypothetical protein